MRSFQFSRRHVGDTSVPFVKLFFVLTTTVFFLISSPLGAQIDWMNTTNSDCWHHDAINWEGGVVPGSSDVARFNVATEYEVWWDSRTESNSSTLGQFQVYDGNVTFNNKEADGRQYEFKINGTAADNDILISGPETHFLGRGLHIHNSGDTQILDGASFTLDGSHVYGAQFTHLSKDEAFNVAGNLHVLSGAQVNGTHGSIGHVAGSTGVATVSSSEWNLSGGKPTEMYGFAGYGLLVGDASHGTLKIEDGGVVNHESDTIQINHVGFQAGSQGFVTITGKDSHWDMFGGVKNGVTNQGGFLFVGHSGSGTVTVESGGRLSSRSSWIGGEKESSMGLVTIAGEGSQWNFQKKDATVLTVNTTGTLNIVDGGTVNAKDIGIDGNVTVHGRNSKISAGMINPVNGAVHIENGGVIESYYGQGSGSGPGLAIGGVSGGKGVVTISGSGSQWNLSSDYVFGLMLLGDQGHGELTIQDGGVMNHTGGDRMVLVGANSGSHGLATVTGPGSQWNLFQQGKLTELIIGGYGHGTLQVAAGGVVSSGSSSIGLGNAESESGTTQSVGVATITGHGSQWNIARDLVVGHRFRGSGTLNVTEGGLVTSSDSTVGSDNGAEGVVTITGKGSHWNMSGNLVVGRTGHGTLNVLDDGLVSVHGTTEIGAGSVVHVDGGRFEFGKTSWDDFATIKADRGSMAGVVTHDGDSAVDSLHAFRNSGVELFDVQVENHGTLHGHGSVDVGVLNHGTIDVKAGEQLQFAGRGSMNVGEIKNSGGEIRFQHDLVNRHGGLIEGHGQFRAGDGWTNEGLIQMTGDAEIHGDLKNSFSGSDTTDIGIHISNGHTVTFHDDVTMVAGNRNVAIGEDGYAVFRGSYNGGTEGPGAVQMLGDLRPGNSAGAVRFEGDLQMGQSSTTSLELGGLFDGGGDRSLTEFDWIDAMGNVELAGALNVELIDGFELHRGNVFEVFRISGTLSGQYDGLGEGALVGRFGNQDVFITYGGGDGNDIALFTSTVPEPTTMLIWSLLAGLGMTTRRRGRR